MTAAETTAMATTPRNGDASPTPALAADVLERLVIGGDLSQLTPTQRMIYYRFRCEAIGLDPGARPFQYMALQGKLTLYADKGCAQQLASARGLSFVVTERERAEGDIYIVRGRVSDASGRATEDAGAVHVGRLQGDALANAIMKAHTKAYRRAVLNHCGLGMLDESEVETPDEAHARPRIATPPLDAAPEALPAWAEPAAPAPPAPPAPPADAPVPDAPQAVPATPAAIARAAFARWGQLGRDDAAFKAFCATVTGKPADKVSRAKYTADDWQKVHRAIDAEIREAIAADEALRGDAPEPGSAG